MKPKTQEALNHAKRLFQQKKYREAADYVHENCDESEQEHKPACVSYFEGECFYNAGEYQMAAEFFQTAYLSSLGEAIQSLDPETGSRQWSNSGELQ